MPDANPPGGRRSPPIQTDPSHTRPASQSYSLESARATPMTGSERDVSIRNEMRGALALWTLQRISTRPALGDELAAEFERQAGGAWKRASAALHPALTSLVGKGYAEQEAGGVDETARRYRATRKGLALLREVISPMPQGALGLDDIHGLISTTLGPQSVSAYLAGGARLQLELAKKVMENVRGTASQTGARSQLQEYSLQMERHLGGIGGTSRQPRIGARTQTRRTW